MITWEEIKEIYDILLKIKKEQKRIWDHNHHLRKKEKKRLMIEHIKKERQENSLILNGK